MRICNSYSLLKDSPCIELGNKAFKFIWRIEWVGNAAKTTIFDRLHNEVNADEIEHKLFSAMLQNEDWEQLEVKE